jgi:hypothetical protein
MTAVGRQVAAVHGDLRFEGFTVHGSRFIGGGRA